MKELKNSSTSSCNSESVKQYAIEVGSLTTNNLFFLDDVLFMEMLEHKQYVNRYVGNVVSYRLVQSSAYLAWNYKTGHKRYVDCKTFRTQLLLFKFFKDTHEGYMDALFGELLDYDLCDLAIRSEHMF